MSDGSFSYTAQVLCEIPQMTFFSPITLKHLWILLKRFTICMNIGVTLDHLFF